LIVRNAIVGSPREEWGAFPAVERLQEVREPLHDVLWGRVVVQIDLPVFKVFMKWT